MPGLAPSDHMAGKITIKKLKFKVILHELIPASWFHIQFIHLMLCLMLCLCETAFAASTVTGKLTKNLQKIPLLLIEYQHSSNIVQALRSRG